MLLFPLTRIVIAGLVYALLTAGLMTLARALFGPFRELLRTSISAFAAVAALVFLGKVVERRPASEWGFPRAPALRDTAAGFGVGMLLLSVGMGLFAMLGWYRVHGLSPGGSHLKQMGLAVLLYAVVAVHEEVLFRGLFFRLVEEGAGTWVALVASALFFGLIHLLNPNATLSSGIAIAIEAGILLGAAYALTRSLWLPMGMHWAWNLFEGPVFGTPVSGFTEAHLLDSTLQGPRLWTGGEFGPEGGVLVTALGLGLGILFLLRAKKSGQLRGSGGWRALS